MTNHEAYVHGCHRVRGGRGLSGEENKNKSEVKTAARLSRLNADWPNHNGTVDAA